MRIVTYRDLRAGRFGKPLARLSAALARGDFTAAGLKKLAPTPFWRAKLSDEARLLLQFVPFQGETVCLFLEVIADHAYEKSRFLRGAAVDRDKIEGGPDDLKPEPAGPMMTSGGACRRTASCAASSTIGLSMMSNSTASGGSHLNSQPKRALGSG